jgi:hypothetical protein
MVESRLQGHRDEVRRLLEANRHLVAALRDALLERHELVGHEITDVLVEADRRRREGAGLARPEATGPLRPSRVLDLRDGTARQDLDDPQTPDRRHGLRP